jgi:hypothetical protein
MPITFTFVPVSFFKHPDHCCYLPFLRDLSSSIYLTNVIIRVLLTIFCIYTVLPAGHLGKMAFIFRLLEGFCQFCHIPVVNISDFPSYHRCLQHSIQFLSSTQAVISSNFGPCSIIVTNSWCICRTFSFMMFLLPT